MSRVELISLLGVVGLLLGVLELVRRERLAERYSLLWLAVGGVLMVLAAWPSALERLSSAVGIAYPPSALFVLAAAFFLVILLHYATVISRLTDQGTLLAQRIALLEARLRDVEGDG